MKLVIASVCSFLTTDKYRFLFNTVFLRLSVSFLVSSLATLVAMLQALENTINTITLVSFVYWVLDDAGPQSSMLFEAA